MSAVVFLLSGETSNTLITYSVRSGLSEEQSAKPDA